MKISVSIILGIPVGQAENGSDDLCPNGEPAVVSWLRSTSAKSSRAHTPYAENCSEEQRAKRVLRAKDRTFRTRWRDASLSEAGEIRQYPTAAISSEGADSHW